MFSFLKLHYYLTGGRGTYLLMLWGLPLLIASLAYLTFNVSKEENYGNVCSGWLIVITGGQSILLLMAAPGALRKAIERDFVTGMIDSHRILPRSNYALALSYIAMPSVQMLFMCGLLFPAGLAFAYAIDNLFQLGVTVTAIWLFAEANLLSTCAMLCALVASMTLAGDGKSNVLGLVVIGIIGSFILMVFIPGLAVITGVFNLSQIPNLVTSRSLAVNPAQVGAALLSQLGLAIIFFLATARRVRVNIWPMYSVGLGLAFLLLLSLVMAISFKVSGTNNPMSPVDDKAVMLRTQLASSLGLFAIVAIVPLSSAISEARVTLRTKKRVRAAFLHAPAVIVLLASLIGALICAGFYITLETDASIGDLAPGLLSKLNVALILATILIMVALDYALLAIGMRLRLSPWFIAIFVLLVLRLAPIMAEALLNQLASEQLLPGVTLPPEGLMAGFSPLGLILSLLEGQGHIWTGLAAQVMLLIVAVTTAQIIGPPRVQPPAPRTRLTDPSPQPRHPAANA